LKTRSTYLSTRMRFSRARAVAVGTAITVGLLLGVGGTAFAFQTYYVGSSSSNGTIPSQGSGASTAGVAFRNDNKLTAVGTCASNGAVKVYYVRSDGSTIDGQAGCLSGGSVANLGASANSDYARCSTNGAFTATGKCWTDW